MTALTAWMCCASFGCPSSGVNHLIALCRRVAGDWTDGILAPQFLKHSGGQRGHMRSFVQRDKGVWLNTRKMRSPLGTFRP